MSKVTLSFAREQTVLELEPDVVQIVGSPTLLAPLADTRAATVAALEEPLDFPPLYRALTPDDHIALVVAEDLAELPAILAGVLEQLERAGVQRSAVTLVVPPRQIDAETVWHRKADHLGPLHLEVHDPRDDRKLAYLANTKAGRRVYLNRTVVDADQVVVVGRAAFDPVFGFTGGVAELFPGLSDQPTRQAFLARPSLSQTGQVHGLAETEAEEVGWLLGMPFFIQGVETTDDRLSMVAAGGAAAVRAHTSAALLRTVLHRATSADLVIATLTGDPERQTLTQVAAALETAGRIVRPGGRIVVLSRARAALSAGFELLRQAERPELALRQARQQGMVDAVSLWQWITALQHAKVALLSDLANETAEELFVTPLERPEQLGRLAASAQSVLIIPDAHRRLVHLA
ncbi:MAG TPA: lactate racemase domain-containing protein [Gemmatales bacterium]|nr:lactate racemase domain-containing protein [Gemmatales bacterium]HMP60088.1 lactate racemase domain-containing protein [Gemmatales bacterium]